MTVLFEKQRQLIITVLTEVKGRHFQLSVRMQRRVMLRRRPNVDDGTENAAKVETNQRGMTKQGVFRRGFLT